MCVGECICVVGRLDLYLPYNFMHRCMCICLKPALGKKPRRQHKPDKSQRDATYDTEMYGGFVFFLPLVCAMPLCVCVFAYVCQCFMGCYPVGSNPAEGLGHASMHVVHTHSPYGVQRGLQRPGQAVLMDHLAHIAFSFMVALQCL